jgi:hypothetical protein|tara:strand:+ start:161 stop:487 length:327 start_codon:yes stop_codon:yes gene_type:complete
MAQDLGYYTPFKASVTGVITISSAASAIRGVLFHGSGTGSITMYSCKSTASATSTTALSHNIVAYATIAGVTVNPAIYYPFPAAAKDGVTIDVGPCLDPKLTLFYSPS